MKRIVFILILIVNAGIAVIAQEIAPDKLFYQAVYAEQVDGDLTKAKALYEQILQSKPDDRALTAKTLYRLGLIGEKEGAKKALGYYTRVIEQYPEQKEVVDMVQTRVDKLDNAKTFTDSRDGHKYKWVKIGNQIWMAENLAYMPHVNPPKKQENGIWVYGYDGQDVAEAKATGNYQKYGCLYSWTTAMAIDEKYLTQPWKGDTVNHQGICPSGWHLPTDTEWKELEMALGMPDSAANDSGFNRAGTFNYGKLQYEYPPVGRFLKSTGDWLSDGHGDNSSGFGGLPGGVIYAWGKQDGGFGSLGNYASFWTSSSLIMRDRRDSITSCTAWNRELYGYSNVRDDIYRVDWDERTTGHSVRCLKNYKGEYPLVAITIHKAHEYIKPAVSKEQFTIAKNRAVDTGNLVQKTTDRTKSVDTETEKILKASKLYLSDNWTKFGRDLHNTNYTEGRVLQVAPTSVRKILSGMLIRYAIIADDKIFCTEKDAILSATDINSGTTIWQFKTGPVAFRSPVIDSETIIFTCIEKHVSAKDTVKVRGEKYIYALNVNNGNEVWKVKSVGGSWNPVVFENVVYFGNGKDFLALDVKKGSEIWKYTLTEEAVAVNSSPARPGVVNSGAAIYQNMVIFSIGKKIVALNKDNGSVIWENNLNTISYSSPTIYQGKVFLGGSDNYFYALDLKTGKIIWRYYTEKSFVWSSPAVAYNSVYFGGGDGSFYCLSSDSGELIWKYSHTDENWGNQHCAIADGLVIFGLNAGKVMALDAYTGQLKWEYVADKVKFFSPMIYKGKVIIGSSDGLYILE